MSQGLKSKMNLMGQRVIGSGEQRAINLRESKVLSWFRGLIYQQEWALQTSQQQVIIEINLTESIFKYIFNLYRRPYFRANQIISSPDGSYNVHCMCT